MHLIPSSFPLPPSPFPLCFSFPYFSTFLPPPSLSLLLSLTFPSKSIGSKFYRSCGAKCAPLDNNSFSWGHYFCIQSCCHFQETVNRPHRFFSHCNSGQCSSDKRISLIQRPSHWPDFDSLCNMTRNHLCNCCSEETPQL